MLSFQTQQVSQRAAAVESQALRSGIADSVAFATHSVSKLEASGAKEGCTSDKFDSERMARLAVDEPANSKSTTNVKIRGAVTADPETQKE